VGTKRKHQLLDQMENSESITEEQMTTLRKLAKDRDADIRYRVAEQLSISDSCEAEDILVRLLSDRDDMVRVSASDSLSACGSREAMELLKTRMVDDMCFMVRGYAAYSAADIALRIGAADEALTAFIIQALDKEEDEWVQSFLCAALYKMGREEYLSRLLGALDHDDYQIRCAAANLLCAAARKKDAQLIRAALKNRREKEDPETLSVISTIDQCLEEMDAAGQ